MKYINTILLILVASISIGQKVCAPRTLLMEDACPIKTNAYGIESAQKSINSISKLWSNTDVLTYSFMYGDESDKQHVRTGIQKVIDATPSLDGRVYEVESGGLIRISFDPSDGAWSYLGTDIRFIPDGRATMNIGWFETNHTVVIHEFLHTLGVYHEHTHPEVDYDWDQLYDDFATNYGWDRATVDDNFKPNTDAEFGVYDPLSIMHYYISCDYVLTGACEQYNANLSAKDIANLNRLYPSDDKVLEPLDCADEIDLLLADIESKSQIIDDLELIVAELITQVEKTDYVGIYQELYVSKYRLCRSTEPQLVAMANNLGLVASIKDKKSVTCSRVWDKIK